MENFLFYTCHKAASMFLHRIISEISNELNIEHYSISCQENYDLIKNKSWNGVIQDTQATSVFGPIRAGEAEPNTPDNLDNYHIILQIRDPRDVLTSLFFSHTYSHVRNTGKFNPSDEQRLAWEKEGIDAYVLSKVKEYKYKYEQLSSLARNQNVLILKYESLVSNYKKWLEIFTNVFYQTLEKDSSNNYFSQLKKQMIYWKLYLKHIAEFKIVPIRKENIYKHRRKMIPGDYKEKLSQETIEYLNDEFQEILYLFDYKCDSLPEKSVEILGD